MSRSNVVNIARRLGKKLDLVAFPVQRGIAYNPHFKFVVRGLFVERTPYKNTYYIWNYYGLLFIKKSVITLAYSARINNVDSPTGADQFEGDVETVASAAAKAVTTSRLLDDRNPHVAEGSAIFKLQGTNLENDISVESLFNLACLSYLQGDRDQAWQLFVKCEDVIHRASKLDFLRSSGSDLLEQIQRVIDVVRLDREDVDQFFKALVRTNAFDLGFDPNLSF